MKCSLSLYMKVCVSTLHPLHLGLRNEWSTAHFIGGWIGWRVYGQSNYEYTYTRVNNNKVYEIPPSKRHPRISILNPSTNQRLSEKIAKTLKKVVANIWQICCKAVILHPLSREKRRWVEMLNKGTETWASISKKTFLKISSEKFWWFKNKSYLCIRFPKESHKEEFFERFRYKQASSTRFVKRQITETVNTWLK